MASKCHRETGFAAPEDSARASCRPCSPQGRAIAYGDILCFPYTWPSAAEIAKASGSPFYLSLIRFGSEPRPNIPTVFGSTTPSNRLGNSNAIGLPRKVRLDVAKCLCRSSASKKACRGRRLPISPLRGEVVGRPEGVKLDGGAPGFWTAAPASHSLGSRRSWWLRVDRECFLKFSQISQGFNQWLDSAFIVLPVLD